MELNKTNFGEEVLKSRIPVLVDFWASWCIPCKVMEPILDKLGKEYNGKMKICKVNTDKNRSLAFEYKIKGLPTFIFFRNGKETKREIAAKSEKEMKELIEDILK